MRKVCVFVLCVASVFVFSCGSVFAFEDISSVPVLEEQPITSELPQIEITMPLEEIPVPLEIPVDDNMQTVISELTQARICLQIIVFAIFPLCVAVISLIKLTTWFSRRFT